MQPISKKKAARDAEEAAFKRKLCDELGVCEICGPDATRAKSDIEMHHIARGIHREKASVARFAVLLLCWRCHELEVDDPAKWPQSRQLAVLKRSRPQDYDLAAFNALVGWGRYRITEDDVKQWGDK